MKTKAKKMAIFVALFISEFTFAQEIVKDDREKFSLGAKAGINFSNVYDEENQDFVAEGKTGFAIGGFLSIPLGKYFGIQPELMYSEKGFKSTESNVLYSYKYTRTTSFVDLPLLLQIKPVPSITFVGGPQFSYLLKTKYNFNGNITTTQEEAINKENYKKNILGFVVGADFNIDHFLISGRAGWDISSSDANGNSTTPRYKNQVIQLALGYRF